MRSPESRLAPREPSPAAAAGAACRPALLSAALLALAALSTLCAAREEFVVTIETTLADTTETFWLQIPSAYDPAVPCPLLVGWHQWGGTHLEMRNATAFDSIADARGWLAAAHHGPSTTHWNNQATQSHVVDMIAWISERYAVDAERIYMVGASMGGAAGMVFSNNHLDPGGPLVAAAASVSGIQDCERRFAEQGVNHSMIAAFGGTPAEVPFEYRRNSAICFADSTGSMHWNARHLPLLLVFGHGTSDQVWRAHAEDLFAELDGWADEVVLRESALAGHGWICAEEELICDFLGGFSARRHPLRLSLNADEAGRAWWAALDPRAGLAFARLEAAAHPASAHLTVTLARNIARAGLDLQAVAFPLHGDRFTIGWSVEDGEPAQLVLAGVPREPAAVTIDGEPCADWSYDPQAEELSLTGEGRAQYAVLFDAAAAGQDGTGAAPAGSAAPALELRPALGRTLRYRLARPGPLGWALLDPAGRRLAGAFAGERPAGEGALELPRGLPAGAYFARVSLSGNAAAAAAARIILVE
ncbi:MAG: prolyl oligopeptidase family serine peptidase [Candidatus Eisenbacteria bacterium]|uniref:Prolyl oligopeptidase family serine peptidase n=1 Tax=Eiseniibacteriota bacterium TaxID=2212470 RepID=A0A937X7F8_UNCEI|nr:prolyl oligopeptidase family serine peptidase [Candidatus Eisenbacteria bacterium]